jgi:RNA polymerase sigma-70 factor (ECF subfamily)
VSVLDPDAKGDWAVLMERLGAFVARRVPPSDADDVLQNVLLKIHKAGGGVSDESFAPWVFTVARNAVTDHFRARRPQELTDVAAADADEERLLVGCIAPFVARLESPYREAITLVELEGLTQQAAADVAGISLSGMKSRVQRGRRLLRTMFETCCALTFDARGRVLEADAQCDSCAPACGDGETSGSRGDVN